nr:3D domain-containing protein [Clostridium rectalis]
MKRKAVSLVIMFSIIITNTGNFFTVSTVNASNELTQTQKNKKELQEKINKLDKDIDGVIERIDKNKKDMNRIDSQIKDTKLKLKSIEEDTKAQNELFKKRVKAMYVSGGTSYIDALLSAEDFGDFISRVNTISKIMEYDKNIVKKLKDEKQAMEKYKQNLDYENNKLDALKESNNTTLEKLSKSIKEQRELLNKETEKEQRLMAIEREKERKRVNSNDSPSRGGYNSFTYSKIVNMESTAYSGDGITATGTKTKRDANGYSTIAVDPRVIPLGTRVFVEDYGYAIAEDIGGAIKGNIIDVFFYSETEARSWGRKYVKVYILK